MSDFSPGGPPPVGGYPPLKKFPTRSGSIPSYDDPVPQREPRESGIMSPPTRYGRSGDSQPMPRVNGEKSIQERVIGDIVDRTMLGVDRYGTALQPHNGRNSLVDLYEELLDATMYVKQRIVENDDVGARRNRLEVLLAQWDATEAPQTLGEDREVAELRARWHLGSSAWRIVTDIRNVMFGTAEPAPGDRCEICLKRRDRHVEDDGITPARHEHVCRKW